MSSRNNKTQTSRIPIGHRVPKEQKDDTSSAKTTKPKIPKTSFIKPPGQTKASLKRQALALSKRLEHTRYLVTTLSIIMHL